MAGNGSIPGLPEKDGPASGPFSFAAGRSFHLVPHEQLGYIFDAVPQIMSDPKSHRLTFGQTTGPAVLAVLLGLLTIAHLLFALAPSLWTWGLDYWSTLPVVVRILMLAVLGLAAMGPVAAGVERMADRVSQRKWATASVVAICTVLFIVFRSRAHVYGDGFSFPGYFAEGHLPEISAQLRTQILDLIAHWTVYRGIVLPLGGPVEVSYLILGVLAGLMSVWAIVRIARCLSSEVNGRRVIVAAAVTSTAVTFWFGYMESYTLTNAAMLWALALALEAQRRPRRIWWAWGTWLLAVAFHQLAVAFLPAILWAHWRARHPGMNVRQRLASMVGTFVLGFAVWGIAAVFYRLAVSGVFLSFWSTPDSSYTAFSPEHLADMLNLLVFVAPLGIVGIIFALRQRSETVTPSMPASIVAVAAASMWYFSFWVDPLIGAFRDWDLLSGFGIPLSIWGGTVIAQRYPQGKTLQRFWVLIGVFAIIHAGAFVATLRDPMKATLRVDGLVRQDMHYSGDFFNGSRLPPWAAVLQRHLNRPDLAKDHLGRRVTLAPSDALAWANLGGAYKLLNMPDSAAACYEQAIQRDPTNLKYAKNLGLIQLDRNDMSGARDAFQRAVSISDTCYDCRYELGYTHFTLNEIEEARQALTAAIALQPGRFEAYYYRGYVDEARADTSGALSDYEAAMQRGCGVEQLYIRLQQLYEWSGHVDRSIEIAHRWEQVFPKSADAPFLLGGAFVMRDQYDSAAAAFTRCLTLSPENALATYYLASSYRNLRDFTRAKQLAERAAQLDTTLTLPYLEMVYIAADAGDRDAARAAARAYVRRSPKDSGMAYLQQFLKP